MAEETNTTEVTEAKTTKKTKKVSKVESVYTVEELAEAAKTVFGTKPYMVRAALDKTKQYTLADAKKIINEFRTKEIKEA